MDYNELHRPQFHFSARQNWINDPNGLVYLDGVWHLYFQHNPVACIWGKPFWGHAISTDLIAWQEQEGHALSPDEHGAMFSGSAVVDHDNSAGFGEGALLAFYTAAGGYAIPKRAFTQCLAYSVDGGANWIKYDGNPVLDCIEGGWDTDCNGATCGSIVGAASGARGLNSSLVAPLNDTIRPSVIGFQEVSMSELAERTLKVQQKVAAQAL